MKKLLGLKKKKKGLRLATSSSTEESRARYRYAVEEYRHTIPHDFTEDGYEDSVVGDHTARRTSPEAPPDAPSIMIPTTADNVGITPRRSNNLENTTAQSDIATKDSHSTSLNSSALNRINEQYRPPPSTDSPSRPYFQPGSIMEPEMVDATYEEHYGDAYLGAPIKYVYPLGYQSMRPRGGPWKLSIVVCVLFTWLSVFIVGHCSDRIENSQYVNDEIDDDALVIETRWCGSHLLYVLWVMSMITTGLAAAYCSVIGYIKVRDFAVANSRSQPPGMVGKSDYYVRIGDSGRLFDRPPSPSDSDASYKSYQRTIYQSDGTPMYWGGHIYRPTQAAVAVTSR